MDSVVFNIDLWVQMVGFSIGAFVILWYLLLRARTQQAWTLRKVTIVWGEGVGVPPQTDRRDDPSAFAATDWPNDEKVHILELNYFHSVRDWTWETHKVRGYWRILQQNPATTTCSTITRTTVSRACSSTQRGDDPTGI